MKLNKLLATAAVVALLPSLAHAGNITHVAPNVADNLAFAGDGTGAGAAGDAVPVGVLPATGYVVASEVANDTAGSATIRYRNTLTTVDISGRTLAYKVTLPAGLVFSSNINSTNLIATGFTKTGETVSGGTVGTSEATFTFTAVAAANNDLIDVELPVKFNGCLGASSAAFELTEAGTVFEATGTIPVTLATCQPAVATSVTAAATAGQSLLSLTSGFKAFNAPADNGAAAGASTNNSATDGSTGTVSVIVNADAHTDLIGTDAVVGDLAGVTFDVVLSDNTGVDSVHMQVANNASAALAPVAGSDGTYRATVAANAGLAVNNEIDVVLKAAAMITDGLASKTVSVTNGTVSLEDAVFGATATDPTISGTLAPLNREVKSVGPIDWVSTTNSISLFRITGLPAGDTRTTLSVTNAQLADGSVPGMTSWPGTITANAAGEAVILSSDFETLFPGTPALERMDATFEFETNNDVDVDRLVVSGTEIFELETNAD